MATPIRRLATRLPLLVLAGLVLAFPASAAANSNNPISQTGGMTATLPLLGTSLTVQVSLDPVGDISGVTLNPTGVVSGTSTAKDVVKFSNADGSVKVTVRASGDRMAIKARATLDKLLGDGSWSANVFGTGSASVAYTIGKDGSGNPTVSLGAVAVPGGVVATKLDPKSHTWGTFAWAWAGVSFSHDGFTKRLTISIGTNKKDGSARLSIVLSGRDRQKLTGTLSDLGGDRTWAAKLCDGTAVSVKYHVTTAGTVAYDGATGAPATEHDIKAGDAKKDSKSKEMPASDPKHHGWAGKTLASGIVVHFDKTGVGLAVFLFKNDDGTYTLRVVGRSGHCGGGKDGHHHRHGWNQGGGPGGWQHDRHHDPKPKPKP